jgi:hypothetical protein
LASAGLCISLWIRAKTVDQEERGNAERRALFVGLWPPLLRLIGDSVQRHEGDEPRDPEARWLIGSSMHARASSQGGPIVARQG